jgi:hypothetical protein
MAKAAGMLAINELVDEQHFHSDDEVGLFLNGWGVDAGLPKLVVCEISNAWLKKHNLSASRSADPNQQRAVHIGTTQQPSTGELTCFYCRIVDSNFPDEFRHDNPVEYKPVIFCLNEHDHVYCVCCNQNVSDEVVFEYIGKYIISKAIADRQQLFIDRDIECARYGDKAGQIFGEGSQPIPISDDLLKGFIYSSRLIFILIVSFFQTIFRRNSLHKRKTQVCMPPARWMRWSNSGWSKNICL